MTPSTPGWTEGLWRACRNGECFCGGIWEVNGKIHVATAHNQRSLGEHWYGSDIACSSDIRAANARLIAASPALYAALDAMVETYWRGSEDSSDAEAPECVKLALAALNAANPARGGK